ncbi:unnamed protein product [Symbiodinium sp. CCMP2592]|nr:unnamed protein product [Symbiodinium sp. CCMP2592]
MVLSASKRLVLVEFLILLLAYDQFVLLSEWFVFGILPIALDEHLKLTIAVSISIALTVAALSALLAGWHRHGQLLRRGVALARRIDIRPALGSVGLYVIICCLCVLLKS